MISRILIANRGEIAVRIIRTCKEMGIESVAVYSTADKEAYHVQMATDSICIGSPNASDSYLNMNNIIQAACVKGCDAIHPGFGFLSENARFARLVKECGLIWIGPDPEMIEKLGNKTEAKKTMQKAGIPIVSGSKEPVVNIEEGSQFADQIGYPIIIKAVNGGGGRGMRIVWNSEDFPDHFLNAKAEAKACFGSEEVYIEKYIEKPKHVEVQVVGDMHGNAIHLYERDCSFQIRNQKMIEEAPCSTLSEDLRQQMCNSALKACKEIGYHSLGTVEFLLDSSGNYYFMEMNTRIQVEHPITEMITGIDLVALQIQLADGVLLPYKQTDIQRKGYALECRITAQDIHNDFAPSVGTISFLNLPGGFGVRVDGAIYNGYKIPPFYDAMICKVITFGSTRQQCIEKMKVALEEVIVEGIQTNEEFHYFVLHNEEFLKGIYDTSFAQTFAQHLIEKEYL